MPPLPSSVPLLAPSPIRLAIQWPRLGPYHLARLRAAHRRFAAEGIEVVALETSGNDATYEWQQENAEEPFRRITALPASTFESERPHVIAAAITRALDRLDPAAVAINSYSAPDARAALLWCRRHRRIAVLMTDSKASDATRYVVKETVKAQIVAGYDAALIAGTPQRAYLEQLGFLPEMMFQPYDVVDNAFFARGAAEARKHPEQHQALPGLAGTEPFFLASARFVPRKNLSVLLDAYARYARSVSEPWRLVLLGDGLGRPALEAQIQMENARGRTLDVTLPGFRQIDELPAYYGLASAFVHVSLVEQWGLVVNEAMAAGLPVVVSRQTGCSQDLVQDNGIRVDGEDVTDVARALVRIADPAMDRAHMGARSREIVAAWSPEAFADGLLQAVTAGRSRADRPMPWPTRLLLQRPPG